MGETTERKGSKRVRVLLLAVTVFVIAVVVVSITVLLSRSQKNLEGDTVLGTLDLTQDIKSLPTSGAVESTPTPAPILGDDSTEESGLEGVPTSDEAAAVDSSSDFISPPPLRYLSL